MLHQDVDHARWVRVLYAVLPPRVDQLHAERPETFGSTQRVLQAIPCARIPEALRAPARELLGSAGGRWQTEDPSSPVPWIVRMLFKKVFPGWVSKPYPRTSYVDFDTALRTREDLASVVLSALDRLGRRAVVPWVDLGKIFRDHQRHRANHGNALVLLTSLEAVLQLEDAGVARPIVNSGKGRSGEGRGAEHSSVCQCE